MWSTLYYKSAKKVEPFQSLEILLDLHSSVRRLLFEFNAPQGEVRDTIDRHITQELKCL